MLTYKNKQSTTLFSCEYYLFLLNWLFDNETFLTKIVFIRSPDFQFFSIQFTNNRHENKFPDFALSLPFTRIGRSDHRSPSRFPNTALCNRPSGIYILAGVFGKNVTGSANFPPGCPFLSGPCFLFFKHTQVIYAGYVKVAQGKPLSGRVKWKISPGTRETIVSLGEGKNPLGRAPLGLLQRGIQM